MGGLLICLGWDYYIGELWSKGGGGTLLKMNYQVDIKTFSSESVLRIRIRWIRNKSTSKTYSFLKELFVMKEIQKELDEREKDGDEEEEKDEDGVRRLEDGVKERLREDVEADRGKLRREVTSTLNFTEVQTLISLINRLFPGVHRQNIS